MRKTRLAAVVALTLASARCTWAPEISIEIQPDGTRIATLRGSERDSDVDPILLFHCAESTLEAGSVYFSIQGRSWSSGDIGGDVPAARGTAGSERWGTEFRPGEASMFFRVGNEPDEAPDSYDARLVVCEAAPALRARLSPAALRRLEAIER